MYFFTLLYNINIIILFHYFVHTPRPSRTHYNPPRTLHDPTQKSGGRDPQPPGLTTMVFHACSLYLAPHSQRRSVTCMTSRMRVGIYTCTNIYHFLILLLFNGG